MQHTENRIITILSIVLLMLCTLDAMARSGMSGDTLVGKTHELESVTVNGGGKTRRLGGAVNGVRIGQQELFRAACCNLGESFSTNPSVDVSYDDAATGAKQIKLLGLSGTYVQMLTETLPAFRGAAAPYALGYVPGTWMKAINVSKGAASVKNGYESITGQIDIDYLKPQDDEKINVNLYGDLQRRFEANADANVHLSDKLFTNLLLHYENRFKEHDGNHDGFQDMPKVEQYNLSNRWRLTMPAYIMHAGVNMLSEKRGSGQLVHGHQNAIGCEPYRIDIQTNRYEAYMKHAFIINPEKQMNIAFMANASIHNQSGVFGNEEWRTYDVNEKNVNAQLMYETTFDEHHALSTGFSLLYDHLSQDYRLVPVGINLMSEKKNNVEEETVPGAYAQYTYTLGNTITAMAGIRLDHSSLYGTFITPRAHIKWQPADIVSFRVSAGKGYRTPHFLAENSFLLSSGRVLKIDENLKQEKAWNYGLSAAFVIPVGEKSLKLNAEYYYTDFLMQTVANYDKEQESIVVENLDGKSYSHVFQVDASYELLRGLDATVAYRRNDVKCTYDGKLMEKPLTSRYKALVSLGYKTPLELWLIDVTLQLNGGGRLPLSSAPNGGVEYPVRYGAFEQLSAQITRRFRHVDVYFGGENLTGYRQKNPIRGAENPWSVAFDPTLIYAPVEGAMVYAGVRIKL